MLLFWVNKEQSCEVIYKNNKQVVGIDITTTAIKMAEITRQQGLFHLKNYGIEPLPRGVVVDKNIIDIELVSDALFTIE